MDMRFLLNQRIPVPASEWGEEGDSVYWGTAVLLGKDTHGGDCVGIELDVAQGVCCWPTEMVLKWLASDQQSPSSKRPRVACSSEGTAFLVSDSGAAFSEPVQDVGGSDIDGNYNNGPENVSDAANNNSVADMAVVHSTEASKKQEATEQDSMGQDSGGRQAVSKADAPTGVPKTAGGAGADCTDVSSVPDWPPDRSQLRPVTTTQHATSQPFSLGATVAIPTNGLDNRFMGHAAGGRLTGLTTLFPPRAKTLETAGATAGARTGGLEAGQAGGRQAAGQPASLPATAQRPVLSPSGQPASADVVRPPGLPTSSPTGKAGGVIAYRVASPGQPATQPQPPLQPSGLAMQEQAPAGAPVPPTHIPAQATVAATLRDAHNRVVTVLLHKTPFPAQPRIQTVTHRAAQVKGKNRKQQQPLPVITVGQGQPRRHTLSAKTAEAVAAAGDELPKEADVAFRLAQLAKAAAMAEAAPAVDEREGAQPRNGLEAVAAGWPLGSWPHDCLM